MRLLVTDRALRRVRGRVVQLAHVLDRGDAELAWVPSLDAGSTGIEKSVKQRPSCATYGVQLADRRTQQVPTRRARAARSVVAIASTLTDRVGVPAVDGHGRARRNDRRRACLSGMHSRPGAGRVRRRSAPRRRRSGERRGCPPRRRSTPSPFASTTCASSAFSTFPTCWLTIGWKTRWPMLPIGPATRTSATQSMSSARPRRLQVELGLHRDDRADALALRRELGVLDRALLELLELEVQLQAAHAERDLHGRLPVPVVLNLEALDAREQLRHLGRVLQDVPDELGRRVELLESFDFH